MNERDYIKLIARTSGPTPERLKIIESVRRGPVGEKGVEIYPAPEDVTYMDYLATTPVDSRVIDEMLPCFWESFANPSSRHVLGQMANRLVEKSRGQIAHLIGANPRDIVFTSGATEAINIALNGARNPRGGKRHIVTSQAEHRAVLDACRGMECDVSYVKPDSTGRISVESVESALRPNTQLVALMWANNEVGTLNPIREIGELCRQRAILFFVDGAQAAGKIEVDVDDFAIDLMSLSAHKIYGPKGVGALYVRRGTPFDIIPPKTRGGVEGGLRPGTLNVPGIVGFGKASEIAERELVTDGVRTAHLRDGLEQMLLGAVPWMTFNGNRRHRLPNCLNVSFPGVDSNALVSSLADIAISTGSACTSQNPDPSHVLRAMGIPHDRLSGAVRFGLGRFTTPDEVEYVARSVSKAAKNLRA